MKVYFDNVDFSSRSGPNSFAIRLAKEFCNIGFTLADPDDYDVAVVFIQPTHKLNHKKPFVVRLDGIWSKPQNFDDNNRVLRVVYEKANSVIVQSQFDRLFIEKHFGIRENTFVVHNGIDQQEILSAKEKNSVNLSPLRSQYDKIYVCSANWHPQKRLNTNYELFAHIRSSLKENAALIVLGKNAAKPQNKSIQPYVYYAGDFDHESCLELYSQCDAMIHLAYADHCPNTCVEALGCGIQLVCTNIGGTKELASTNCGFNGVILREEKEFDNKAFDYDNPPNLDVTQFVGFEKSNQNIIEENKKKLDIKNIAQQYIKILKETV